MMMPRVSLVFISCTALSATASAVSINGAVTKATKDNKMKGSLVLARQLQAGLEGALETTHPLLDSTVSDFEFLDRADPEYISMMKTIKTSSDGHSRHLQIGFDPTECSLSSLDNGDPFWFCPNFCGPGKSFGTSSDIVLGNTCVLLDSCVPEDAFSCNNFNGGDILDPEVVCPSLCSFGITAGGDRIQCFENSRGLWQCTVNLVSPLVVSTSTQGDVPIGRESGLLVACDQLTDGNPDPRDCTCVVVLEDPFLNNFTEDDFCASCEILDGDFNIAFDCSNKLSGDCVGITNDGFCISTNLPPAPVRVPVPITMPFGGPVPAPAPFGGPVPAPAPFGGPVPAPAPFGAPIPAPVSRNQSGLAGAVPTSTGVRISSNVMFVGWLASVAFSCAFWN